jgi:integrase/recombinase XerD
MNLTRCIHQFFEQYLPRIKGCSVQTIKAYRDTFKLFFTLCGRHTMA